MSLNGTSAYTYSETTPTVGSGSVFVQETVLTSNSVAWSEKDQVFSDNYLGGHRIGLRFI